MEWKAGLNIIAAVALVFGAVECFAGYRIMKTVLAVYGFLAGAVIGITLGTRSGSFVLGMVFVLAAGTALAMLSHTLYQAGVFLLVSTLATFGVFLVSKSLPSSLLIGAASGVLAIFFVKPLVITTSALSGAQIMLSAAYALASLEGRIPFVINFVLWLLIAAAGVTCQYITTLGDRESLLRPSILSEPLPTYEARSFSEKQYPGMQRAYRNFCIRCGCEMNAKRQCPRCGFRFDT